MPNDSAAGPGYRPADLIEFVRALFAAAGCDGDKPQLVAELLVDADLLGHTTHGLQLAAPYLGELESGAMRKTGEPEVVADRGATVTWDGRRLPGVWLTARAIDLAVARARRHGLAAVTIRRSHHIACLEAFLQRATDHGMMIILVSSDPSDASVAPYGGLRAVFNPVVMAVGIPTEGEPMLIDFSAAITTNGMSNRLRKEGKRYPGLWAQDAAGTPTDDPNAIFADPPGTILPLGGTESGYKGFGLMLMIEALSQGFAGFGRADPGEGWGAGVFILVLDPAGFAGADAFRRQTEWTARICRDNPPAPGVERVRLPGTRGLARRREALAGGLQLYPGIMDALLLQAEKLGVAPPKAIG